MPGPFAWVPDVSRGEWLRPMEAETWASTLSVVPRGFEAYARIFHTVERDRPRATGTWHGVDETTLFDGTSDVGSVLETETSTWAQLAAGFGTTMHAEAQYTRLVRQDDGEDSDAIADDGWRYGQPSMGACDPVSFVAASGVLARHTTTPEAGVVAVWEGWGGLMSSAGYATFSFETDPAAAAGESGGRTLWSTGRALRDRGAALVRRGIRRVRRTIMAHTSLFHRTPEPGTGLLPRAVASGPTFALHGNTGRTYVLFEAGASDLAEPSWVDRAPWVRPVGEPQTPSILWPDDHAWVLATEIDYDSTLVAGSAELVRELLATPGLEVLAISPTSRLTQDGDTVNGVGRPTDDEDVV